MCICLGELSVQVNVRELRLAQIPAGRHPRGWDRVCREIFAAGAEVRDLARLPERSVVPVLCRDEGLQVNELISAAPLAVRAAHKLGIDQGSGGVRFALSD